MTVINGVFCLNVCIINCTRNRPCLAELGDEKKHHSWLHTMVGVVEVIDNGPAMPVDDG